MSEMKIETELLEATKLKAKKHESRQEYMARLCRATAKVTDEIWEGLSTAAQDWNNAAAEALSDGKEIADFLEDEKPEPDEDDVVNDPVDDEEEKEPEDEEDEEELDEEEDLKPLAAKAAKQNGKAKGKPEPEVEDEPEVEKTELRPPTKSHPGRKVSACHTIKKLVVKKPSITVAELAEKLKASGLKVSDVTIATLRSDLRDTLRVLNEVGKGEFVL